MNLLEIDACEICIVNSQRSLKSNKQSRTYAVLIFDHIETAQVLLMQELYGKRGVSHHRPAAIPVSVLMVHLRI